MIYATERNRWTRLATFESLDQTPVSANGLSVTLGVSNADGSYSANSLVAPFDAYFVYVCVCTQTSSNQIRDALVTIGIDTAGGTSYVDFLPSLFVSSAGFYRDSGNIGVTYRFPIFVPEGARLSAKGRVNNASAGNCFVDVWLFGGPTRPDLIRYGYKCTAYGTVPASSRGTLITPGTTSKSSWLSLGSITGAVPWWWQIGFGMADASQGSVNYTADLAIGNSTTNLIPVMQDRVRGVTSANEEGFFNSSPFEGLSCIDPRFSATNVYARSQCNGTPDSNVSIAAYGIS